MDPAPAQDEWDHEAEALLREAIAAALEEEEEGNEAKAKKKAPEAKCRKKAFEETAEEEELEVDPCVDPVQPFTNGVSVVCATTIPSSGYNTTYGAAISACVGVRRLCRRLT